MKKLLLTTVIMLFAGVGLVMAQLDRGNVMAGISSTIDLIGNGPSLMSIGYTTIQYKEDSDGYTAGDPDKMTRINLSPRVGFFVVDNLLLGADLSYAYSKTKDGADDIYASDYSETLFSVGPFVRYYVPFNRAWPFVELSGSIGSIISKSDYRDNSIVDDSKYTNDILALGGGLGLAVPIGEKVVFDALAGYSFLQYKYDDSEYNERMEFGTIGLKLGFTLLLAGSE
ncbi:MAG: hypothetical protein R2824_21530 [Saprospiraceae bacterium]|nr:outer membrane beta-barrel protein [Lewinella sp.]